MNKALDKPFYIIGMALVISAVISNDYQVAILGMLMIISYELIEILNEIKRGK